MLRDIGIKELFKAIAESWIKFMEEEDKINLCIDANSITEYNKFTIDENLIEESQNYLYFYLPDKIISVLKQKIINNLDASKDINEISFEYTLAFFLNKHGNKYCPFLFQINTLTLNNSELSLIKESKNKDLALNELLKIKRKIILDFFSLSSSTILATNNIVNSKFTNIDREELNALINEESPISILEIIFGIDKNKSLNLNYKERFTNLINQIKKINDKDLLTGFLIFDFKNVQDSTKNIKEFLKNRIDDLDTFYNVKLASKTPIYQYLFGTIEKDFDEYNKPSNTIWFGHATEYPLSKGQALVLQRLEENENLIAVQGPPGTGKTTLLLNIIAWALVKRALAIINEEDINNLVFVTSTANKAVDNATRDFKETFINNLNFYSDFFLDLRNTNTNNKDKKEEKKENNIEKIKKFLEFLENSEFSEEEYNKSKENINFLVNLLNQYEKIFSIKDEIKLKQTEIDNLEIKLKEIRYIEDLFWKEIEKDISKENFLSIYNELENQHSNYLLRAIISGIPKERLKEFIDKLNETEYEVKRKKSFLERLLSFIKKDYLEEFNIKYHDILRYLNIKINKNNISDFIDEINKLRYILEIDDKSLRFILSKDLHTKYKIINKEIIHIKEKKSNLESDIRKLEENRNKLMEKIKEVLSDYKNKTSNNETSIDNIIKENLDKYENLFEFYRKHLYKLNQLIIKHSINLLKNYCLKEKENLKSNLELFMEHFIQRNNKHKEISNRIKDFYKYLSLAFPVAISTLHSSTRLFGGFDKTLIQRNINPIFISFIDEAGMANVYLSSPIISLSDKVVSVGDPLQLPPVIPLNEKILKNYHENFFLKELKGSLKEEEFIELKNKYSPAETSVYHRSARCKTGKYNDIGQAILLDEHRRCQEPIANLFIKLAEYKNVSVKTNKLEGNNLSKVNKFTNKEDIRLIFYNVKGEIADSDKTNKKEAEAIKVIIEKLQNAGYSEEDIGIITPFVDQEIFLRKTLNSKNIQIGTVHKFQGQEFPVIIFSTVISSKSQINKISFLNTTPNLLNVAVSRAKHLFITVGNFDMLNKSGAYLKTLTEFFLNNEHSIVIQEKEIFPSQKNYNGL